MLPIPPKQSILEALAQRGVVPAYAPPQELFANPAMRAVEQYQQPQPAPVQVAETPKATDSLGASKRRASRQSGSHASMTDAQPAPPLAMPAPTPSAETSLSGIDAELEQRKTEVVGGPPKAPLPAAGDRFGDAHGQFGPAAHDPSVSTNTAPKARRMEGGGFGGMAAPIENPVPLPQRAAATKPGDVVAHENQGAIRNRPVAGDLQAKMAQAVTAVYGPGTTVQVYSGGQSGPRRTGSRRHNDTGAGGQAGDVHVYRADGSQVKGDALAPLAQYWLVNERGSVGLEMRGGGIHLDNFTEDRRKGGETASWFYGKPTLKQWKATRDGRQGIAPAGDPYGQRVARHMPGGGDQLMAEAPPVPRPSPGESLPPPARIQTASLDPAMAPPVDVPMPPPGSAPVPPTVSPPPAPAPAALPPAAGAGGLPPSQPPAPAFAPNPVPAPVEPTGTVLAGSSPPRGTAGGASSSPRVGPAERGAPAPILANQPTPAPTPAEEAVMTMSENPVANQLAQRMVGAGNGGTMAAPAPRSSAGMGSGKSPGMTLGRSRPIAAGPGINNVSFTGGDSTASPEMADVRQAYGSSQLRDGLGQRRIEHFTQGLDQMADAGLGAWALQKSANDKAAYRQAVGDALGAYMQGDGEALRKLDPQEWARREDARMAREAAAAQQASDRQWEMESYRQKREIDSQYAAPEDDRTTSQKDYEYWRDQQIASGIPDGEIPDIRQYKEGIAEAGAPKLGDSLVKTMIGRRDENRYIVEGLDNITEMRRAIDAEGGMYSGSGTESVILPLMGIAARYLGMDDSTLQNTEVFMSQAAKATLVELEKMKGAPSNKDLEFVRRAAGGDVSLTEGALRRLLTLRETALRRNARIENEFIDRMAASDPSFAPYADAFKINLGERSFPVAEDLVQVPEGVPPELVNEAMAAVEESGFDPRVAEEMNEILRQEAMNARRGAAGGAQ